MATEQNVSFTAFILREHSLHRYGVYNTIEMSINITYQLSRRLSFIHWGIIGHFSPDLH